MTELDYRKLKSRLTARRLIRALLRDGFVFARSSGSHHQYRHPDGRMVTVTYHHGGATFETKLLKSMLEKQARWTMTDLQRLKLIPKRGL